MVKQEGKKKKFCFSKQKETLQHDCFLFFSFTWFHRLAHKITSLFPFKIAMFKIFMKEIKLRRNTFAHMYFSLFLLPMYACTSKKLDQADELNRISIGNSHFLSLFF